MMNFTVLEDTSLAGQLPGDPNDLTFLPVGETQTRDGVVTIQPDGSFTYQPDQSFNGEDQFFFASVDADGRLVGFGAIDIVVEAVNDAPVADPVMTMADEDVGFSGVLTAFDEEGDELTFSLVEDDEDHLGVLTINPDGRFTYRPDQDANGSDSFQFQVSDGEAVGLATFDVAVNPVNDAPIFRRDLGRLEVLEDTSITFQVVADDPEMDAVKYFLDPELPPVIGTATLSEDGMLTYTPRPDAPGEFSFFDDIAVIARDEQGAETKTSFSVDVIPVNDPPIVEDISFEVVRGQSFGGQVSILDPDGSSRFQLEVSDDMPPSAGSVITFIDSGGFIYEANDDAPMTDSFTLFVIDGGFRVPVLVEVQIVDPEVPTVDPGSPTVDPEVPTFDPEGPTNAADRLSGTSLADVILGMDGDDTIFGDDGADQLEGGRGADSIDGGTDNDTVSGGAGGDTLIGGFGADLITGGAGADSLVGDAGADLAQGGGGRDVIMGGAGRDVLEGGGGRDTIEGDGGRDRLDGGAGFDVLTGGRGADTLTGGGGSDRFVFGSNHGRDEITDFVQGRDKIVIETGLLDFDLLRITQNGDDVQIRTGGGRVIVLDDEVENFEASDFIF